MNDNFDGGAYLYIQSPDHGKVRPIKAVGDPKQSREDAGGALQPWREGLEPLVLAVRECPPVVTRDIGDDLDFFAREAA